MTKSEYITKNFPELTSSERLAKYRELMATGLTRELQISKCERLIVLDGERNNLPEDIISQAVEMFDKAVRRGLSIQESMLDIVDMMHDVAGEYS